MPSPQNGRHLGGDEYFVPTRGTGMESGKKTKLGVMDSTMTTRDGQGQEQGDRGEEGQHGNPFAKASRVARTPTKPRIEEKPRTEEKPRSEAKPRTDSCPELKQPMVKAIWPIEDREKRKRGETASTQTKKPETKAESRIDDDVFLVEGSLSPDAARKRKKTRELAPFSTKLGWTQLGETEDESALSNGLIQLMTKLEYRCSELTYETKKHQNTKVEIKKLAQDIDLMAQGLARKLHKYCKIVAKKLRKSSGDETTNPDTASGQLASARTRDAASQTESSLRKKRRGEDDEKRVAEATSDEDIIAAAKITWQEEWFKATSVRVGNPWNSSGEEDFAILLSENEVAMESGIARLLKDRFPKVAKIEGTGFLKATNTTQLGTEDPVIRSRIIYRVNVSGTTEADILSALKTLKLLAAQGSGVVAIPIPTGMDEEVFRKLIELAFRKEEIRVMIHVPQRKGGKTRTAPTQRTPVGETRRSRREKDTEVLLIKQGERSYTEMVKGLKAMAGVNQDLKTIQQVRKTQDGRMLLSFKKGEPNIEEIKEHIKTKWESAEVSKGGRRESEKLTLHVKVLDDAVEDEDIREAICAVAPALQKESMEIGPRRPMFGGNLAVTVRVAGQDLKELRGKNKVRIGFNMCTVEERVEVTKCFRCWEFGHLAKNCTGPDRRTRCNRCGEAGHLATVCKNPLFCLLCDATGHRGSSGMCPKFRSALSGKRMAVREKAVPPPQDGR